MFGSVTPTSGGLWFHYKLRRFRLAAHVESPGVSGLTVLWKGATAIDDLGAFFEHAAVQVKAYTNEYKVLILNRTGARPFQVPHVVPIPNEILTSAQFIRFECRPESEAGESPLIVWINLDREVDPAQESIGVYMREGDLPTLTDDISRVVARTTSEPRTPAALIGDLENEVRHALSNLQSDIREAAQQPSP